jgi:hypothetical protein
MNRLSFKSLTITALLFALAMPLGKAQSFNRYQDPKQNKGSSSHKPLFHKKVKGPANIEKTRKAQEDKKSKLKKDYDKYVKENQKRSIEIQTPEVKARMKQNIKDADSKYKTRHKTTATKTRRAGRKYR